ncbi:carboxylesterase/lipase family protein [Paenibacillus allorhizosphaerae]|uniref:Carboxylic ester hydrolase n=1 Tax=Paenibacillus allorhizosphaerae TaxID=2849866 RepID=A0ABM8VPC8_9BACL|nr:carboxylesterase/lipase family protein [Paenibacillus allorhizosphaerae]CAG7652650.1 Para-nitrobenzyl esterase [Paenibacillus allorhizosphaerae]
MIITTNTGQVRGVQEGNLYIFRGIPYAEAPVGERRFLPPYPKQPWDGILEASRFGLKSYQPVHGQNNLLKEQSEDCLSLNIWTSGVEQANRPVLVNIHGGGFVAGTGAEFAGLTFAKQDNIVCVSLNYRLGALGFLHLGDLLGDAYQTSGNNGILDIVAALKWVKENISCFGGDPNRITVSGVSAGAKCASTLLTVPAAQGLFHQVIARSGATQSIRDTRTATLITLRLLDKLGIPHKEAHRLLTIPAQTIIEAQDNSLHTFGPVRDGLTIPMEPITAVLGKLKRKIPLLLGTNKDEAASFITNSPGLKVQNEDVLNTLFGSNSGLVLNAYRKAALLKPAEEAWKDTLTDCFYRIAAVRLAEMAAEHGQPVWLYRFEYAGKQGAVHGAESPFVNDSNPTEVKELATRMHAAWAAFIRSGEPTAEGLPEWPAFTLSERSTMVLNQECRLEREADLSENDFPMQVIQL